MYTPYVDTYVPFGNESACSFDPNAKTGDKMKAYKRMCAAGMEKKSTENYYTRYVITASIIGMETLVLAIIIIIIIIIVVILIIKKWHSKRRHYERIPESVQQDHTIQERKDDNNNGSNSHD